MADIPGDTSTTASISVGGTLSGTLEVPGDHDWFRVTLTAGQTYTISVTGSGASGLADSYLNIYDSTGTTILASNDDIVDGTNRNSLINFTAPTSGTYYLDVGSFQNQYAGAYQLSLQPYSPPPLATNDQIADQLANGFWGGDAHHFNVTQGGTITVNISTLNASEQNLARAALAEWSDIIGVTFREVTSGALIDFDHTGTQPTAATDADWVDGIITHAHVHISTPWVNRYGTSLYSYSFQSYVHEIGHALGLGHAGNYNNTATYPNDALFQNDAWSTSIMSYFDQQENSYFSNQGFSRDFAVTPMAADILAMQSLYGLSTSTRTSNTTYGFNTNVGGVYDAVQYPSAAYTIFDSGGTDTLDFSGSAANQLINLNPETFSNVDGQTGNLSIARGVVIENAIGGGAADTLIGNFADNTLTGNGGSDTLTGGAGNDIFKDSKAGLNGDTIIDFSPGDKILFTDANIAGFTFNLSGHTLTYTGGSLTLTNLPSGTISANAAAGGGVQLTIVASSTTPIPHAAHNDFNGDGLSDVLWRSDSGLVTNWLASGGGQFTGNTAKLLTQMGAWQVAGTSDFNGDGRVDVLWRYPNGLLTDWLGQPDGTFAGNDKFVFQFDNSWHVAGTGDFNGDGRDDILWRHDSGLVIDWLGKADGSFGGNSFVLSLPSSWQVAGTGDFNGDGRVDILWRNSDGTLTDWLGQSDGSFAANANKFTFKFDNSWHVAGTGDFNGDGRDDILWRHDSGLVIDWTAQADGSFAGNSLVSTLPSSWQAVETGDFNGDGVSDILWRNSDGTVTDWLGQGNGSFAPNASLHTQVPTDWHVQPTEIFL